MQALDAERETLRRLSLAATGERKRMAAHSRQFLEQQLGGSRSMPLRDLAYALAALPADRRSWVVAPLLAGEDYRPAGKPVLLEASESLTATAELHAEVCRAKSDGTVDRNESRRLAALGARAMREAAEVVAAAQREAGE